MASNAQGKPSATDFTGSQRAALQKAHVKEQQERDEAMTLATAEQAVLEETTVHDVTSRPEVPVVVDEVEVVETEDGVIIRTNEDLQQVTIGEATYDFIAGRKYKVPANVAFVLREKQRLWL